CSTRSLRPVKPWSSQSAGGPWPGSSPQSPRPRWPRASPSSSTTTSSWLRSTRTGTQAA
ncbi:MAG: hypothetical protein AVDCRST_MAG45-1835, partial [uncultured Solirubrobacterales bacterium]